MEDSAGISCPKSKSTYSEADSTHYTNNFPKSAFLFGAHQCQTTRNKQTIKQITKHRGADRVQELDAFLSYSGSDKQLNHKTCIILICWEDSLSCV